MVGLSGMHCVCCFFAIILSYRARQTRKPARNLNFSRNRTSSLQNIILLLNPCRLIVLSCKFGSNFLYLFKSKYYLGQCFNAIVS